MSFINKICINLINPTRLVVRDGTRQQAVPQKALFFWPCAHLLVAVAIAVAIAVANAVATRQPATCSRLAKLAGRFVIYRFTGKAVCHKTPLSHPKTHK